MSDCRTSCLKKHRRSGEVINFAKAKLQLAYRYTKENTAFFFRKPPFLRKYAEFMQEKVGFVVKTAMHAIFSREEGWISRDFHYLCRII